MKLRFLDMVDSDRADFPFVPGQIIHVPNLSKAQKQWIRAGRAEIVREEPEHAVVMGSPERAVAFDGRRP